MFDIVLPSRGSTAYFGKFAVALFLRKAAFFCLHLVSRAFSGMTEAELKKPVDIYFAVKNGDLTRLFGTKKAAEKTYPPLFANNPF
ncbi:hypothetical protein MOX91_03645 [Opitutales bacterium CLA-KB-P66]|uniref:Uncharacterized protein n=2 Tax=Intestinicryptomonas porci TaxID=2926320 RepID=A0ABU4WIF0_9BACT|nr:hypothetical protein [Opitutales bacterium CLA-KB-P66]